jgi:hypothetical protein
MPFTELSGQNWLIAPAALAVNDPRPASITDQVWSLLLTGVVTVNPLNNETIDSPAETITIVPDFFAPLESAIQRWRIPVPTNPEFGFSPFFSLQEWAPFAGAGTAGVEVDVWRPTPFNTDVRDASDNPIANVFAGMNVDIKVIDNAARRPRVTYNIALLGKIVFARNF